MSLKDKLLSSYIAFEDHLDDDSPIHDIRNNAIKVFEAQGFPTKKEEAYKYTSLKSLIKHDYSIFPKNDSTVELKDVKKYFLHDIDTYKLVFIDGIYSSFLSNTTHDSIDVCLMSSALSKPKYSAVIETYFNKAADKDSLASLNTAFAKEGAYIYIPKHKEVEKPIEIVNFSTGSE
ncbi:MAG: Fe-S cluster assembly protein SufD, partial [Marinirhabdus sp.]|nr:Fe-S cluster assembly protein SufD [Marinirhabdus sp.]